MLARVDAQSSFRSPETTRESVLFGSFHGRSSEMYGGG